MKRVTPTRAEIRAARREALDSPVYWFALLDGALGRRDFRAEAEARRQLERLGYTVHARPRLSGEIAAT
jgi:hypothetical protein